MQNVKNDKCDAEQFCDDGRMSTVLAGKPTTVRSDAIIYLLYLLRYPGYITFQSKETADTSSTTNPFCTYTKPDAEQNE